MPLYMNGLQGRMLRVPAPKNKKREILFIYGHHSSLERWWGVIQDLNQYGAVTVPDLPGFGGMQSLYKIGEKPDIDTLADYLAAFIKLRYKRRRVTLAGLSFGFVIITRMLQRYPDLTDKVDLLISVVGFAHREDFIFTKPRYWFYRSMATFFSLRLPAVFFRNVVLHPILIKAAYGKTRNAKDKFKGLTPSQYKEMINFEIYLWHCNDVRTYMKTSTEFLTLDNCKKRVNLPLWHVVVDSDRYLDPHKVSEHLHLIYSDVIEVKSKLPTHAPSIIADKETAKPLFPTKLRRRLARQS